MPPFLIQDQYSICTVSYQNDLWYHLLFCRYSRRTRSNERGILTQGLHAPDAPMTAPDRLPPALQKEQSLQRGSNDKPHVFNLPPNTAGTAKIRSGPPIPQMILPPPLAPTSLAVPGQPSRPLPVILPTPVSFQPIMLLVAPPGQTMPAAAAAAAAHPSVPYTTEYYRKKKMEKEQMGMKSRKYVRKTEVIICKKCSKERKPPSHIQYFGNWFCEETATESFTDWRAALQTRGYGKKRPRSEEK